MLFSAAIKNLGPGTMPAGTIANNKQLAVGFYVDDQLVSWADRFEDRLQPGETTVLVANGGPGDTAAGVVDSPRRFWVATAGDHAIKAHVNEITSRKAESNFNNNTAAGTLHVASLSPGPQPGPDPPPSSGTLPGLANTGTRNAIDGAITFDQWLAAGSARNKSITGMHDEGGQMIGRTLSAVNCVFEGFYYIEPYTPAESLLPVITLTDCVIRGGLTQFGGIRLTADALRVEGQSFVAAMRAWLPGGQDHEPNQTALPFPWRISNSWFHSPLPVPRSQGGWAHMEALHMVGGCVGPEFRNVRFTQDGNANVEDSNVTGIVKTTSIDALYEDCQFDWIGAPASYFSLNMEGRNVRMIRCKAAPGSIAFFFNSGVQPQPGVFSPIGGGGSNNYTLPTLTDCTNLQNGSQLRAGM